MQFGQRAVNCIYMTSRYQFFRESKTGEEGSGRKGEKNKDRESLCGCSIVMETAKTLPSIYGGQNFIISINLFGSEKTEFIYT